MSFTITRRPEKLFASTTKLSRWTAAHNPYIFEFTREDVQIYNTAIRNAYSTTLPTVWTNTDLSQLGGILSVGDTVYINSGVYNGIYTVHAINGQYLTIDTPFIGNGGSGRLNFTQTLINYRATINVYDRETDAIIDTVYPKPDTTGLMLCDVSGIIRSTIETAFNADQSDINVANKGLSGGFYIGYSYSYTLIINGTPTPFNFNEVVDETVYYWTSSARQITGDISLGINGIGQNLKEYVPKNFNGSEAKFLTMFERPTYFEGFPFTLSFLYDRDFSSNYLVRHQQDVNVNGVNVGSETDNNLLVSGRHYLNQMNVRTPNTGSDAFNVWLEVGDEITNNIFVSGDVWTFNAVNQFSAAYIG